MMFHCRTKYSTNIKLHNQDCETKNKIKKQKQTKVPMENIEQVTL